MGKNERLVTGRACRRLCSLADRQYEQTEMPASTRAHAHAQPASSRSSLVEATLGVSLAEGDLKRAMGQIPR